MMEWIKVLEIPALMLAALVIVLQFRQLDARNKESLRQAELLSKMAAILDLICLKVLGGKSGVRE
jgi:hypothetical protein